MTDDSPLRRVRGSDVDLEERLAGTAGLFLGVDFDGTLAAIASDPAAPEITEENRRMLERLAQRRNVSVAVVSGRALSDLVERVDVENVTYSGNHGLERRRGGERFVPPEAAEYRPVVQRTVERLRDRLEDVPGAIVEDKELTITVHYRQTPDERVDTVRAAVEEVVSEADDDLDIVSGKKVFEVRPPVDWNKGTVIDRLADDTPANWATMYIGDDTTDEDAFEAIAPDGIGVVVGDREETAATHRLPSQADVAPFLEWLANRTIDAADR